MSFASVKQQIPQYYYTITGDVKAGDNKNAQEFTQYASSRFPINAPQDISTQAQGWGVPFTGQIVPSYDRTAPGMVPAEFAEGRSVPVAHNA